MSKKNVQVHCLPTENGSKIWLKGNGSGWEYLNYLGYSSNAVKGAHYLYITTDESPKDGDWYLTTDNRLVQWNKELSELIKGSDYTIPKKVVASDNSDLWLMSAKSGSNGPIYNIGNISLEFQQAYVRECNKGNVIVNAMMEFDEYYNFNIGDKLIVNKDVFGFKKDTMITVESIENEIIHFEEDNTHKQGFHISHLIYKEVLKPKLNEQGYVTILPIAEKLYTKEEVIELIKDALDHFSPMNNHSEEDRYIEQHL